MIRYEIRGRRPARLLPDSLSVLGRECLSLSKKEKASDCVASVVFVDSESMRCMNRTFRGKNKLTDVLSFSTEDATPFVSKREDGIRELGDIFICSSYARAEAKQRGVLFEEEIYRLIAHGTLHLLGYDHADTPSEKRMFGIQEAVVSRVMKGKSI